MDKPSYKLVGQPCGHQGQYTFYKALRICGKTERIIAIGDFFFVKIWQDSELVSVGELQLLWTDRISDQTLVSLRLYFLPENTPDGRNGHGEHEVLAINELMVVRADDLLSWMCTGEEWHWGLQAVWRSPEAPDPPPAPLHSSKLDFTDVDSEKAELEVDINAPGVVVFSYPRYCRYRALVARLEGIQASWLRDSLVAALGGYSPPTQNTRILYCRDTFEYPELEGHEFVCNQLAPKARPRARRRRHHHETEAHVKHLQTPRRLRNESETKSDSDESAKETPYADESNPHPPSLHGAARAENKAFIKQLKSYHKNFKEKIKLPQRVRAIPLVTLYAEVKRSGGFSKASWEAVAKALPPYTPSYLSHVYQRYLLAYESFERQNGAGGFFQNGVDAQAAIVTATISDESPERETKPFKLEIKPQPNQAQPKTEEKPPTPNSPHQSHTTKPHTQTHATVEFNHTPYDPSNLLNLNTETGETEPVSIDPKTDTKLKTDSKISVKPVEKLLEPVGMENGLETARIVKGNVFLDHLAQKFNLVNPDTILSANPCPAAVSALSALSSVSDKYTGSPLTNGSNDQRNTTKSTTRSSLRSVRVKPARESRSLNSANSSDNSTASGPRPDSASSSPPTFIQPTNLTTAPQNLTQDLASDDEIIEVPYKPKTPEIIDLDEYPESPQNSKKKKLEKLDLLKERGLEVTSLPSSSNWNLNALNNRLLALNPQHQILTPAQLFQVYPTIPPYNGVPPKIVQGKSIYGNSGIERTVYGNPKDPYMAPPHIIHGAPVKPNKNLGVQPTNQTKQDILDLTCKNTSVNATVKPAVEIVRVPTPKLSHATNLTKNYTLLDGKAVVGSNLEITLVNPKSTTPVKQKNQKRSSNGQFVSLKTPTPTKEQKPSTSGFKSTPNIVIPNYQPTRDSHIPNPTQNPNLLNMYKDANISQLMEMQAGNMGNVPFMDPMYMGALYSSLAGQFDQRQLAFYRDLMANQFSYSGLLNLGVSGTPTTKN